MMEACLLDRGSHRRMSWAGRTSAGKVDEPVRDRLRPGVTGVNLVGKPGRLVLRLRVRSRECCSNSFWVMAARDAMDNVQ